MAGVRRALIVATDQYTDPKLTSLNAPANDASALAEVLRDDAVGCFEVTTVLNRPSHEIELAIADFFGAGKYGDTLLAHFSCHGVKSPTGELYFATTNTSLVDTFKLKVTGVPSALVRDAMEESRASLILCLVDCCYSGAFVKLAKAADTVDLTERLGGKGRAIITASTSLQLALDGEEEPSLFTRAVIDGLRSGEADRDLDGLVSLDELYSFVHERVSTQNPNQTPVKSFDVQGEVYVARRSTPVTDPAPLDPGLLADARASVVYQRLGAVSGLAAVLEEGHPGRSLAARMELARIAGQDDSLSVRGAAQKVLDSAGELPTPAIPDLGRVAATRSPTGGATVPTRAQVVGGATEAVPGDVVPDDVVPDDVAADGVVPEDEPAAGGGGSGPGARDQDDEDGASAHPRRRRRALVAAAGLVVALVLGGVAWRSLAGDEGSDTSSGGGDSSGPVLPDTEALMGGTDPELGKGILAFDVATGETRMVVHDPTAGLPTISPDRQWMVYLTSASDDSPPVPRLARVDGSDDGRLLDARTSRRCPFTTRPAFSPDGQELAVICLDTDGDPLGLGIVDRDGRPVRQLTEDHDLRGAPTWTDDDQVVYMRDLEGNDMTTLWSVPASGGEARQVTDGLDGADSHPDWSTHGLLFLRAQGTDADVVYMESLDARGVTPITTSGDADSPTWAPGDEPKAIWLQPAPGKEKTLWVTALGGGSPTELNTAVYGPPAWGSR